MDLIEKIIDDVATESTSLNSVLLKTKVLASKLESTEVKTWVDKEINGYKDGSEVPDYRKVSGILKGVVTNGLYVQNDVSLVASHLGKELHERLTRPAIRNGISSLEKVINSNEKQGSVLSLPVPPEMYPKLSKVYLNDYHVQQAYVEFDVGSIADLLTAIRSRLIDFLLGIKNLDSSPEETNSFEVTRIFQTTIIGSHNTVLAGDSNTQIVHNQVVKNDIESLKEVFREANLDDDDIAEITAILQEEEPDSENQEYGPRVKGWLKKMMNKAIDGYWKISTSAAGRVLGDAISSYYGF